MRIDLSHIRKYRVEGDETGGRWLIPVGCVGMRVIASWEGDWDHVSVSTPRRTPTWEEMHQIKAIFFMPEECVVQYHPPESDYVNNHPYCLHLWRPQKTSIPTPPKEYV